MRLGVSISSSHRTDGPRLMIERARAAYDAGFRSLTVGDHHNTAHPFAQNTPILGRLLAEWQDRPAGCLFLVPLWNPLLMAEHIGTLAAAHDAPFIVQTGIGGGADQFAPFGADLRTRGRVLEESIRIVKALLAGETVTSELLGHGPDRDHVVQLGLRPQRPVEWWISAGVDTALRRAATMGDAWYGAPGVEPEEGAELVARYRDHGGTRAILRKDVLVLADGDRARQAAADLVDAGYRGMALSSLIVGDPDDAAEQLDRYANAGFDEVIVRCMSVPQDQAIETLSLLGPLSS